MSKEIIYRRAVEDDYPAILELYNEMYQSQRDVEQFLWLVKDNPAGQAIVFLALKDTKVVGIQSLIPYYFVRNGDKIVTYKSEDSLVKDDLRGKGIYSNLYKMVHEFTPDSLVWGLTDKKVILEKVGMPSSQRLTIAVSVNRPGLSGENNGLQKFVAKSILYTFLYLKSAFQSKRVISDLELIEISKLDFNSVRLKSFFDSVYKANPDCCFPLMNADYLDWRLTNNPNLDTYKVFCSTEVNGSILICSIIGYKGKSAYWQSFYSLPEATEEDELSHILTLKKLIFNSEYQIIHTWLFENNPLVAKVKHRFLNAGFSKVRKGLWIVNNSDRVSMNVNDLYFSPQLGIR